MTSPAKVKPDLLGLSVAEAKALLLGIVCEEGGKVDMEKLALKYPYKNSASAGTSYRNAKRKLLEWDATLAADGSAPANSAATPGVAPVANSATGTPKRKTPAKRKKGASTDSEAAAGPSEDATGSPKPKRQRKTPVKKGAAVKSEKIVEEDDGETNEDIIKTEPNVDENEESTAVDLKGEGADDADNGDVKMEETGLLVKFQDDDELASIDLDAELDALDTPTTIKDENEVV